MRYKISYYFGDRTKFFECETGYEMENIIEFMRKTWNMECDVIMPIKEEEAMGK